MFDLLTFSLPELNLISLDELSELLIDPVDAVVYDIVCLSHYITGAAAVTTATPVKARGHHVVGGNEWGVSV